MVVQIFRLRAFGHDRSSTLQPSMAPGTLLAVQVRRKMDGDPNKIVKASELFKMAEDLDTQEGALSRDWAKFLLQQEWIGGGSPDLGGQYPTMPQGVGLIINPGLVADLDISFMIGAIDEMTYRVGVKIPGQGWMIPFTPEEVAAGDRVVRVMVRDKSRTKSIRWLFIDLGNKQGVGRQQGFMVVHVYEPQYADGTPYDVRRIDHNEVMRLCQGFLSARAPLPPPPPGGRVVKPGKVDTSTKVSPETEEVAVSFENPEHQFHVTVSSCDANGELVDTAEAVVDATCLVKLLRGDCYLAPAKVDGYRLEGEPGDRLDEKSGLVRRKAHKDLEFHYIPLREVKPSRQDLPQGGMMELPPGCTPPSNPPVDDHTSLAIKLIGSDRQPYKVSDGFRLKVEVVIKKEDGMTQIIPFLLTTNGLKVEDVPVGDVVQINVAPDAVADGWRRDSATTPANAAINPGGHVVLTLKRIK
jgi:hypothetical protein